MFLFFILFSIISLLHINLSYIVLPFEIFVEKYISNDTENPRYNATKLLNEWFSFNLFAKLQIGFPVQEISAHINPQKSCFQIKEINIESIELDNLSYFFSNDEKPINLSLFNLNDSQTFKDVSSEYSGTFFPSQNLMGNDQITFYNNIDINNSNNIKIINNLHFLVNKKNYEGADCTKEKCGMQIGIKMFNQEDKCPNFNKELKKSKTTEKYIFSINYISKYSGSLILGAYPHEYFPDKYKQEQLFSLYTSPESYVKFDFNMIVDDIISFDVNQKETQISNNTKIIFKFYYGFFIGTYSYQEYIEKYFFNDLINNKICYNANRTKYGYIMYFDIYFCKEDNIDDIKKFPALKFYLKNTNTSFIFNFDDLFIKIGDKYYFMVIFEKYHRSFWEIGYPFFKKYDIVFDDDSKTISYYNTDISNKINNDNENNMTIKIIVILLLSIIIFCLLLGVGFYFGKKQYMQRKKRANELDDDDYDYITDDKINIGNGKNENNKIINCE